MAGFPSDDEGMAAQAEAGSARPAQPVAPAIVSQADKAPAVIEKSAPAAKQAAPQQPKASPASHTAAATVKPGKAKPVGRPAALATPKAAPKSKSAAKSMPRPAAKAIKPVARKISPRQATAMKSVSKSAPASLITPATKKPSLQPNIKPMKDYKMATTTPDFTNAMTSTVADLQDRSKAAYEKSTEMMSGVSETAKGAVEAVVESGKIFSTGMQDMAKTYVEDAKSAYEQMTADLKEMAAVKSPTDLLQMQGKIMRRNFDAMVASSSKNAEKMMKLSNESFAPLSARLSAAAEKAGKLG